jgi:hypothetical protein
VSSPDPYAGIEAELIAYVVTEQAVSPLELQNFLTQPRVGYRRAPTAFVPVTSLPRTPTAG